METTVTLEELARATEDLPLVEKDNDKNDGAPAALMTSRTHAHEACKSGLSAVPGRPAEPSEADIATLTAQYRKAVNGLYEAYVFGQMLMAVKTRLEAAPRDAARGTAGRIVGNNGNSMPEMAGWNAGTGLKAWLAEHCPEINYSTARRFLAVAENTNAALAAQAQDGATGMSLPHAGGLVMSAEGAPSSLSLFSPSEAQVRAFLEGKSQRAILRRGGSREGAGRKAKDFAKALDANGEVAWHEIEEPLAALSELIVAQGRHTRLNPADLETLRASIDLIHERVHAEA